MKKVFTALFSILFIITLSACTIDLSQPTNLPPVSGAPSPPPNTTASSTSASTIPITWQSLGLTGRLVYSRVSTKGNTSTTRIQILDLTTGAIQDIFTATGNAWVYYLTVSPDETQLLMSYTPPAQPTAESITSVYSLPLDGSAPPKMILTPPTTYDRYIQVEWSPDGKYIYFVHYNFHIQTADQIYPHYETLRMAYPNGQPQLILDKAFWPRLSSNSSKVVYVSLDPISGINKLNVANADGTNAQTIPFSGPMASEIVDAPMFLPDGKSILFSAPSPTQSYQPNWLDRLLGVQIAKAHNIPSDWWSVPLTGGEPTRLTQLQTIRLYASLSPDKKYLASVSGDGIFLMDMNGSNLTQLLSDPGIASTVNWIP